MVNLTVLRRRYSSGFTLLEVMIAVTIFASMAVVISGTTSQAADTALTLENKTLANWVAENRLNEIRLTHELPAVGNRKSETTMAGRDWLLETQVESTDFPQVVRVTVNVFDAENKEYQYISLATVMGAYD